MRGHIMNVETSYYGVSVAGETRWVGSNSCHAVRASRKAVVLCYLYSQSQVQRYNKRHPAWHLLAFSIAKMGENMRLTNGYSVFYNH